MKGTMIAFLGRASWSRFSHSIIGRTENNNALLPFSRVNSVFSVTKKVTSSTFLFLTTVKLTELRRKECAPFQGRNKEYNRYC
jgi:hypothetical protein